MEVRQVSQILRTATMPYYGNGTPYAAPDADYRRTAVARKQAAAVVRAVVKLIIQQAYILRIDFAAERECRPSDVSEHGYRRRRGT